MIGLKGVASQCSIGLLGWGIVSGVKLVDDLDRGRGADARCAGLDHGQGLFGGLDAASGFDFAAGGGLGHQANMLDPCAAGREKAGAGLDKINARGLGDAADEADLLIGQGCRFDDDF